MSACTYSRGVESTSRNQDFICIKEVRFNLCQAPVKSLADGCLKPCAHLGTSLRASPLCQILLSWLPMLALLS